MRSSSNRDSPLLMSVTSHGPPVLHIHCILYVCVCVCRCVCAGVCVQVCVGGGGSEECALPLMKEELTKGVSARGPVCLGHSTSEQHLTLQRQHQQSRSFIKHNIAPKLMEKLTRVVLLTHSIICLGENEQCFNSLNLRHGAF